MGAWQETSNLRSHGKATVTKSAYTLRQLAKAASQWMRLCRSKDDEGTRATMAQGKVPVRDELSLSVEEWVGLERDKMDIVGALAYRVF